MMHPYAEGNIAAAKREIARCLDAIKLAIRTSGPSAWEHVGSALAHATNVSAQLDHAMEIEAIAEKENAA